MSFLGTMATITPTVLGAGAGYFLGGGTPMGAQMGAMFGGQIGTQLSNIISQERNLQYQKNIQRQIFAREDSAVRRRVEDLRAAGLSPVLGAGQSADAGAVVSTKPVENGLNPAELLSLMSQKQNIDMSQTQQELVRAQTATQKANASYAKAQAALKWHDYNIFSGWQRPSNFNNNSLAGQFIDIMNTYKSNVVENAKKELQSKIPENIRRPKEEIEKSAAEKGKKIIYPGGETYGEKALKYIFGGE